MGMSGTGLAAAAGVAAVITYVLVRYWLLVVKAGMALVIFLAALGAVVGVQFVAEHREVTTFQKAGVASACRTP